MNIQNNISCAVVYRKFDRKWSSKQIPKFDMKKIKYSFYYKHIVCDWSEYILPSDFLKIHRICMSLF